MADEERDEREEERGERGAHGLHDPRKPEPPKAKQHRDNLVIIGVALVGVILTYLLYRAQKKATTGSTTTTAGYSPGAGVLAGGSSGSAYSDQLIGQLAAQEQANAQANQGALAGLAQAIGQLGTTLSELGSGPPGGGNPNAGTGNPPTTQNMGMDIVDVYKSGAAYVYKAGTTPVAQQGQGPLVGEFQDPGAQYYGGVNLAGPQYPGFIPAAGNIASAYSGGAGPGSYTEVTGSGQKYVFGPTSAGGFQYGVTPPG